MAIKITGGGTAASDLGGPLRGLRPTAATYETFPRYNFNQNNTGPASGTMQLTAIYLPQGAVVANVAFVSGNTAINGPTHQIFGVYDSALNRKATSADDGATAWSANAVKTLAMTSAYTVATAGLHYLAVMTTSTVTQPSFPVTFANENTSLFDIAPKLSGTSSTGLTTTIPDPAAAITTTAYALYAYVS